MEKFGVIFAIWDGKSIQLEKRLKLGSKFFGLTIVPGGGVETGETYQMAMKREVSEEYGVKATEFEPIGVVRDVEEGGIMNIRHVFLVTKWEGRLSNPERVKSKHLKATIEEARVLCTHPISQRILNLVEVNLKG